MTLDEVLNKTQMKGVTRYSIGVGDGILKKPNAIKEMMQIADPGKYYNVSSYGALNDILSSLERGIIGTEGTQQGFELQLAEAGFSSHLLYNEQKVEALFGAVGAYDWSGGVFLKSGNTVKFLNDSHNETKFGYLGYSVTSAHLPSKTLYISGAPRYNLTGGVFIFDDLEKYVLHGDQVGSYFGSVLCALDINKDDYTDHLLVGAPHFHLNGEEGKVLVYKLNQEDRFERAPVELRGDAGQTFARFGAAIGSIGDIDNNKFNDVAVGAPLETGSAGSVYIYSGFEEGLRFSQKISPSDFGMKLVYFGQSVSVGPAPASDIPCIAVGSLGRVSVFETIPVLIIEPTIKIDTEVIALTHQMNKISSELSMKITVCFNIKKGKLKAEKSETQAVDYEIDLDSGASKKRLTCDTDSLIKDTFTLTPDEECTNKKLKYLGCFDCFSPIKIKLSFSLASNKNEAPIRILDAFTPTEVVKEIPFEKDCQAADCKPSITLSNSKISETTITMGETQNLNINFNFTNTGDPSYMTTLTLTYPSILSERKIEGAACPVKNDNQIQCHLQHPVFTRSAQTNLFISWQLNDKSDLKKSEIIANLTSQNNGIQLLDSRIYTFNVMYSLPILIRGSAEPNRLRIEEGGKGKTQPIKFKIQFQGENKYGATIDVIITIKMDTSKTDLHITKIQPEVCVLEANKVKEASYIYKCTLKELQVITIEANVFIHDVQDTSEKIIVEGQYSYDETLYSAKDTIKSFTLEVPVTKMQVMTSKGPIIGGSIGGFLFLLIFIIILIKCGFFRRRHKVDQTQNQD
nr:integrin alpha-E isoform X2 [Danio rerio]|eukprot:XP_021330011.1 integrin alpha-E isoform X2 [Danio rerio]